MVAVAQAGAMPEQVMADSVAVVDVVNKDSVAALMLTPETAALVVAVVEVLVRTNKALAAPLLWLSSGEVSRHEIRIPE